MSPKSFEDRWLEFLIEDANTKAEAYVLAEDRVREYRTKQKKRGDNHVPEIRK